MSAPATPVPGNVPNQILFGIWGVAVAAAARQDINTVNILARVTEWLAQIDPFYKATAQQTTQPTGFPATAYPYSFANFDANAFVAAQTSLTGPQLGA